MQKKSRIVSQHQFETFKNVATSVTWAKSLRTSSEQRLCNTKQSIVAFQTHFSNESNLKQKKIIGFNKQFSFYIWNLIVLINHIVNRLVQVVKIAHDEAFKKKTVVCSSPAAINPMYIFTFSGNEWKLFSISVSFSNEILCDWAVIKRQFFSLSLCSSLLYSLWILVWSLCVFFIIF